MSDETKKTWDEWAAEAGLCSTSAGVGFRAQLMTEADFKSGMALREAARKAEAEKRRAAIVFVGQLHAIEDEIAWATSGERCPHCGHTCNVHDYDYGGCSIPDCKCVV